MNGRQQLSLQLHPKDQNDAVDLLSDDTMAEFRDRGLECAYVTQICNAYDSYDERRREKAREAMRDVLESLRNDRALLLLSRVAARGIVLPPLYGNLMHVMNRIVRGFENDAAFCTQLDAAAHTWPLRFFVELWQRFGQHLEYENDASDSESNLFHICVKRYEHLCFTSNRIVLSLELFLSQKWSSGELSSTSQIEELGKALAHNILACTVSDRLIQSEYTVVRRDMLHSNLTRVVGVLSFCARTLRRPHSCLSVEMWTLLPLVNRCLEWIEQMIGDHDQTQYCRDVLASCLTRLAFPLTSFVNDAVSLRRECILRGTVASCRSQDVELVSRARHTFRSIVRTWTRTRGSSSSSFGTMDWTLRYEFDGVVSADDVTNERLRECVALVRNLRSSATLPRVLTLLEFCCCCSSSIATYVDVLRNKCNRNGIDHRVVCLALLFFLPSASIAEADVILREVLPLICAGHDATPSADVLRRLILVSILPKYRDRMNNSTRAAESLVRHYVRYVMNAVTCNDVSVVSTYLTHALVTLSSIRRSCEDNDEWFQTMEPVTILLLDLVDRFVVAAKTATTTLSSDVEDTKRLLRGPSKWLPSTLASVVKGKMNAHNAR